MPLLICWVLFPTLIILILLSKNKNNLHNKLLILRRIGYLFINYKKTCYFWEFIKIYHRLILVIITYLFYNYTQYCFILIFLINLVYLLILNKYQSY